MTNESIYTNRLKEFRKKQGLLQEHVAQLFGFKSPDRISHWENGRAIPSLPNLMKLCVLYNAGVFELYPLLMQKVGNELEIQRDLGQEKIHQSFHSERVF